jgi:hypothetical protein
MVGRQIRRRGYRLWPVAVCSLLARPLLAEDSPFRLSYQAPRECPESIEFARLVVERSAHGRLVTDQSLARSMTVAIRRVRAGYQGTLEFIDFDAERVVRELRAPTCRALAEALALVTALAIDAQLPPDSQVSELETPDEYFAPSLPKMYPEPMVTTPAPPVAPPSPPPGAWRVLGGAGGRIDTAAVPGIGWGLFGFAELVRLPRRARIKLGSSWGEGTATTRGEHARFDWLTIFASGCPVAWGVGVIDVAPCAVLEVGGLRGQGRRSLRITTPESNLVPWAAVGLLGTLHMPLGSSVNVGIEAGPLVPLSRPRFEFYVPDVLVFRPPPVGLTAGLELSLKLL